MRSKKYYASLGAEVSGFGRTSTELKKFKPSSAKKMSRMIKRSNKRSKRDERIKKMIIAESSNIFITSMGVILKYLHHFLLPALTF